MRVCSDNKNLYLDGESTSTSVTPTYNKSYCKTSYTSSIFDYTWQLENFSKTCKSMPVIHSAPFPEEALYRIKMKLDQIPDEPSENVTISFYMLAKIPFQGICEISTIHLYEKTSCITNTGLITNESLVYRTTAQAFLRCLSKEDTLMLNFTITVFHNVVNESMHITTPIIRITDTEKHKQVQKVEKMHTSTHNSSEIFVIIKNFITSGVFPPSFKFSDLLTIATQFDIKFLKATFEQNLINDINVHNAISYLTLAIKWESRNLEKFVLCFIKFHFEDFGKTRLHQLSKQNLEKVLRFNHEFKVKQQYLSLCPTDTVPSHE